MSKRQVKKIYPGFVFQNRKFNNLKDKLINSDTRCLVCGSRKDLEPHHIIPCHVHDKIFFKEENIAVLCRSCHNVYHQNYFPINEETLMEFKKNYKPSKSRKRKSRKKKAKKYKRKTYEPHPLYSKIRINDFKKPKTKTKTKKKKRKRKRKRKRIRFNPIFLTKNLGTDYWSYFDKIGLEKEVLGDLNE